MAGGGGGARGSDRAGAARSPTTTTAIQSTIQSIKEVVGGHSDADILDTLRESNMDPNETAQKLLNQDPFHEVKRKRDKKKESTGQKSFADSTAQVEQNSQWMKPHTQRMENDQRRTPNQGQMSGPSHEFRVVRDNRFQHGVVENRPELGHKGSSNVQMSDRSTIVQSGRNRSPATTSDGQITHQNAMQNSHSDTTQGKRDGQGTTQKHAKPYLKNSQNEQHFPGSDPAHGSANVRIAGGTVGPARRHVGVINSTRQFAGRSGSQMHAPSGSSHANIQRGSFTSVGASGRYPAFMSRNIQQNQRPDTIFRGRPTGRSFVAQNVNRYHQGPTSNQKAVHPVKEWKPKSTKKSPATDADNNIAGAASPSASNCENANASDVNGLSEKLSQANLHEVEHVIIPEHLRVPEYEQTKLRFGSFTSGLDSEQVPASAPQDTEQPEHLQESVQQVSEDDSLDAGHDDMDEQARSSQLSTTTAEISLPPSEDSDRMSGQVENDDGLGLVQSDTPVGAADGDSTQITSTLTPFSAYGHEDPNMHTTNEAQLYGLVEPNVHPQVLASSSQGYPSENPEADNAVQVFRMPEPNVHSQVLPSTSEALNPQIVSNSPVPISSQQQHLSQQQAAAQMYPQMHVQHFPNFMPYRQLYSPVYPMPMPNYSPNVPYPSNGNNYLQMPSGGSHLTAGGVKYGVSQYKPVPSGNPSGYGNYTHPAGFTMGSPGVIGAAVGVDDVNRMKYKDNIYASTPQVETSDIWIQPAREMPPLQVPSYYNIPGQATPGAFVPNPANASFNATAQSSHAQFPGLYHPQQPPSIVSPHPMVHQQVPSAIGPNVGVGVAAPGPQVGAYQQPQLGHMNWRPSF
ncbi:uncharacterized protein [Miscanthus floridulus]|uniref:uncharacterized protein isoform X1 n=1 Tax=Miscanthus floridulus TaxID=154761 RepID=UPI00345A2199